MHVQLSRLVVTVRIDHLVRLNAPVLDRLERRFVDHVRLHASQPAVDFVGLIDQGCQLQVNFQVVLDHVLAAEVPFAALAYRAGRTAASRLRTACRHGEDC